MNSYKDNIREEREMSVYKRDDMIQKARFKLSVQEQRTVLYAISKIKPEDTHLTEYTFDIKDFYQIIGWEKESYNEFKAMLKGLRDRSWWAEIDDKGTESAISWFNTIRTNQRSGKVSIKFHEDMMPFLVQLIEQGEFYTSYNLKYVLPMSSKHSPRLYEILKSYQKNNSGWYFEINRLKKLLDCENYKNFNDFKRRVLIPAVEEINKYTDISIAYDEVRAGIKVTHVQFYMDEKTKTEKFDLDLQLQLEFDGELDIQRILDENHNSNKTAFVKERRAAHKADRGE